MPSASARQITSSVLAVALLVATTPALASPPAATLTGTVYAGDLTTPLAGATVVASDASGAILSSTPTSADGAFTIPSLAPGRTALTLRTSEGSFAVATPVTLAPGASVGVRIALKASSESPEGDDKDRRGAGYWSAGSITAMTAVLVGFAAALVVNADRHNDEEQAPVASPSAPEDR
jgi:hypothetical protein